MSVDRLIVSAPFILRSGESHRGTWTHHQTASVSDAEEPLSLFCVLTPSAGQRQELTHRQRDRERQTDRQKTDRRVCVPGMSFLLAMAAALCDSYSMKAKPLFLLLSVELGYMMTSTTPSVTWYTKSDTITKYTWSWKQLDSKCNGFQSVHILLSSVQLCNNNSY